MATDLLKSAAQSPASKDGAPLSASQISSVVQEALSSIPFIDIHTHLFAPSFGRLCLWGIEEVLTYHYLEAELFRSSSVTPEHYWTLPKSEQADLIWRTLFVENTPISESTRGVIAVLNAFQLPTDASGLATARSFFKEQKLESHITNVLRLAGVSTVV